MLGRTPNIEHQSDEQLLHTLLRSDKRAAAIASEFAIEKIANAQRHELGLTQAAYDRLMAGIELGRRIHEAKARYDLPRVISSSSCADAQDGWFIAIREGGETRRIKVPVHDAAHLYPCPSPDGKQIAFSMLAEDGTMQIGLTSWDGKEIRQLTQTGNFNTRATFSPDGKYLAFIRGLDSPARLMIVNIETGKETLVASDVYSCRPVWRTITEP